MNTTATTERIPSPTEQVVTEAPAPRLPAVAPVYQPGSAPPPAVPSGAFNEVVAAVAGVMEEIEAIRKGGENTFHGYKYARMQDILQVLTPLMGKHGLTVFQYESARQMFDEGRVLAIQYHFVVAHKSGQAWAPVPQTGMSPCRTSNGKFDDKAFAKCHTSARKYFLLSLFQVPTEDEADPDNQHRERSEPPVPGPDGRTPPYRIAPVKGETPRTWANKYLKAINAATSDAELVEWDTANDDLLTMLDTQAGDIYTEVQTKFEAARSKYKADVQQDATQQTGTTVQHDPGSAAFYDKTPETTDSPPPAETEPFVRPDYLPDPERDPDGFISAAAKKMASINNAAELDLIWEQVIDPAANGMMPPDFAAVQAEYEAHKKRLGGD